MRWFSVLLAVLISMFIVRSYTGSNKPLVAHQPASVITLKTTKTTSADTPVKTVIAASSATRTVAQTAPEIEESNTLEAYDKNSNGVWDDVDQKIEARWKNDHPNVRKAAAEMAKALQNTLDASVDIEVRDKALGEAVACMLATERQHSIDWTKTSYTKDLRKMVISNHERTKLYIKYNGALSGKMISVPSSSLFYCKYNNQKG